MRRVEESANGPGTKGLAELNHHNRRDEVKEVSIGYTGEQQGLFEEDDSRINGDAEDINRRCMVQAQSVPQKQQLLPQASVVRWDRFLPVRSLRVLLVENDDSTRHVVSALLRNCSYEVTAVGNGLEAWEILEDAINHIDLVLTEVDMPYLSGIGLLAKIMSHKTCKNIPLIMMSSNDSMGIVFKCLSKGAVDFLVKPIRKNELKNLWQHVWRKCHSSSFSGSESGIRMQKPSNSRSVEGSDNNTGSNGEDDNWSTGLNVKDGSDNGSGTQNSWSKRVVEVDSIQPLTQWDQSGDPPDSICGQVIHSGSRILTDYWVPRAATRKSNEEGDELAIYSSVNVSMGKYLEIGVPKNQDTLLEEPSRNIFDLESKKNGEKLEKGSMELNSEAENCKYGKQASDYMGVTTSSTNPQMESVAYKDDLSKSTNIKDKITDKAKELSSLEPDVNRVRDGDTRNTTLERNVLRHSNLSAFSRYTSNTNQAPTGNVGSCSPPDNSSDAAKTKSMHNIECNSNGINIPNQLSNGSSNNDDMGSTTNNAFSKPETFNDKKMSRSLVNAHPFTAFQSLKSNHGSSVGPEIPDKVQVQHHHHHYHHHHHHVHNMQQKQQLSDHDNLSFEPPDVVTTPIEGNAANYGSASGSNSRSNGENGKNISVRAEGTNMESDNGGSGNCGAENLTESGSRSGVDQNRLARREAALNKFRQKRKDRCFEKKVRYQSRKKLAEQRPRVKGQFVRQIVNKGKIEVDQNS